MLKKIKFIMEKQIINKSMLKWWSKIKNLPKVNLKKTIIDYYDINYFDPKFKKLRSNNDKNNKIRENIICNVINNNIPIKYYKYSLRWIRLKKNIGSFIKYLCKKENINDYKNVFCIQKGGRRSNYDFLIEINNIKEFKVEFKFNTNCLNGAPQFSSPMRPSQYLHASYEEYYYDNYLGGLLTEFNLEIPKKNEYLKNVHSTNPKCIEHLQKKYYNGCITSSKYTGDINDIKFYETAKQVSKESIYNFIKTYGLNIDKLTNYLLETQKDKYYMLYTNNSIYLETINLKNYIITEAFQEPKKSSYILTTQNGSKLKVLLRWKNGNGIAYPAFQIS